MNPASDLLSGPSLHLSASKLYQFRLYKLVLSVPRSWRERHGVSKNAIVPTVLVRHKACLRGAIDPVYCGQCGKVINIFPLKTSESDDEEQYVFGIRTLCTSSRLHLPSEKLVITVEGLPNIRLTSPPFVLKNRMKRGQKRLELEDHYEAGTIELLADKLPGADLVAPSELSELAELDECACGTCGCDGEIAGTADEESPDSGDCCTESVASVSAALASAATGSSMSSASAQSMSLMPMPSPVNLATQMLSSTLSCQQSDEKLISAAGGRTLLMCWKSALSVKARESLREAYFKECQKKLGPALRGFRYSDSGETVVILAFFETMYHATCAKLLFDDLLANKVPNPLNCSVSQFYERLFVLMW